MTDSEIELKEARRAVDFQFEKKGQIETKAGRALQFVFTVISIALAAITVLYYFDTIQDLRGILQSSAGTDLSAKISSQYPVVDGDFVVATLLFILTVAILFFVIFFFVQIPWKSYLILRENGMSGSIHPEAPLNTKRAIDEYSSMIGRNEYILQEDIGRWEDCHQAISFSLLSILTILFISLTLFVSQDPSFAIFAIGFSTFTISLFIQQVLSETFIDQLREFDSLPWLLTSVFSYLYLATLSSGDIPLSSSLSNPVWPIMLVLAFSFLYPILKMTKSQHEAYLSQNFTGMTLTIIVSILTIAADSSSPLASTALVYFLVLATVITAALSSWMFRMTITYAPPLVAKASKILP